MGNIPIIQSPEPIKFLLVRGDAGNLLCDFQQLLSGNTLRRFGKPDAGHTLDMHHTTLDNYILLENFPYGFLNSTMTITSDALNANV